MKKGQHKTAVLQSFFCIFMLTFFLETSLCALWVCALGLEGPPLSLQQTVLGRALK
jgi:hypothetical protein